ncbi:hypothetical protein DMENIID0001_137370 [Sergentomyia squamirostris]
MESINREENNACRHQSKKSLQVASNNVVTWEAKKRFSSSSSSKTSSKVKEKSVVFGKSQQKESTKSNLIATESKEPNFEYDDHEWDIRGIGDLITDLDADIEKSSFVNIPHSSYENKDTSSSSTDKTEKVVADKGHSSSLHTSQIATMSSTSSGSGSSKAMKLSVDHQATLEKGLKMKIKRTKPGTKTSEAKHVIVKSEQNGFPTERDDSGIVDNKKQGHLTQISSQAPPPAPVIPSKRNSSHRRDKVKDKAAQRELHEQQQQLQSTESGSCGCSHDSDTYPCGNVSCPHNKTASDTAKMLNMQADVTMTDGSSGDERGKHLGSNHAAQKTDSQQSIIPLKTDSGDGDGKMMTCGNVGHTAHLPPPTSSGGAAQHDGHEDGIKSPPMKKLKCDQKVLHDMSVGTSVGTITEPDCLGPCEPGTSVTLEGIVWHETEGGVLVVNVTWRGKTYVGTLLDCTQHDWAPPRFCDSPIEDLDMRTPKSRAKRGRSAANTSHNDLSNFTETRSSVHSKLRNCGAKGRGGQRLSTASTATTTATNSSSVATATTASGSISTTTSSTGSSAASSSGNSVSQPMSPVSRHDKRKSRDESETPSSVVNATTASSGSTSAAAAAAAGTPSAETTQNIINPITGLNVQIVTKKCTITRCPVSPVLLECPEQDCNKKYKNPIGLKYHQSHAHGGVFASLDEESPPSPESPQAVTEDEPPPSVVPLASGDGKKTLNGSTEPIIFTPDDEECPEKSAINLKRPDGGEMLNPLLIQSQAFPLKSGTSGAPDATKNESDVRPMFDDDKTSVQDKGRMMLCTTKSAENLASAAQSNQSSASDDTESSYMSKAPTGATDYAKQTKKNRKSPPIAENANENTTSINRTDDVKSPAYSDISDDSTPVIESESSEKLRLVKGIDERQPIAEVSSNSINIGNFGMYPFYSQSPFMVSPEHLRAAAAGKPPIPSAGIPRATDYATKVSKESQPPPVDLMTKQQEPPGSGGGGPGGNTGPPPPQMSLKDFPGNAQQAKVLSHFYPYNFMSSGYAYDLESSYGAVGLMTSSSSSADENKDNSNRTVTPPSKEENNPYKQTTSPNDPIKTTPSKVSIKVESSHGGPKELSDPHLSCYTKESSPHIPNHFPSAAAVAAAAAYQSQRPPHGVPTSVHQLAAARDEDLKRFYVYPDSRRLNPSAVGASIKDEPYGHSLGGPGGQMPSSQQQPGPPQPGPPPPVSAHGGSQANGQQQSSSKAGGSSGSSSGASSSAPSSASDRGKMSMGDVKSEDGGKVIKQEGQKPTMETQGPPPPPTSQYYLPYINHPSPFPFDTAHPMYRNMLVSASPYNHPSPYHHIQMAAAARYHSPEDLSRTSNPKAMDLLQHQATQYYNSHKIHELSERALKSPTSGAASAGVGGGGGQGGGPPGPPREPPASGGGGGPGNAKISVSSPNSSLVQQQQQQQQQVVTSAAGGSAAGAGGSGGQSGGAGAPGSGAKGDEKGGTPGRSPPPQRHVHTHHHTHVGVGLGYPMYPAPYGAAVIASQQAAAVAVINPFPPPGAGK